MRVRILQSVVSSTVGLGLLCGTSPAQSKERLTPLFVAQKISSGFDKESSDFKSARPDIALTYWRRGNDAAAFAEVDAANVDDRRELLACLVYASLNDPGRARTALKRALELEPTDDQTWLQALLDESIKIDDLILHHL